jgi:hypothetical protein
MKRKTVAILLAVGLPLTVVGYVVLVSAIAGVLTISTDKAVYRQGENITFTVRNNSFNSLQFPNPGLGFRIMNLDTGEDVSLGWLSPQVIHSIQPLSSQTIRWDQTQSSTIEEKPFGRELVKPGNYVASVRTAGGFEPKAMAEVKFKIL